MDAVADAAVVAGDGEFFLPDLDLDALLASFSGAGSGVSGLFAPSPPAADAEAGSPESVSSRLSPTRGGKLLEIERFLMEEEGVEAAAEGVGVDDFFDSLLVDCGEEEEEEGSEAGGSTGGESGKDNEVATPEAEKEEVDGDDPISKKKRRQMRNRDSAMKSRERKKMYVKDLESKSKYLEAECRRLSYALQCCAAENMALRQSLLKDRPVGAAAAMQESAVLTETLPLVSLLWLVSIVCLLLMPGLPNRNPVARSSAGRDLATVTGKKTSSEQQLETLKLLLHGRRCKGSRARIKLDTGPFHAAAAAC
ncbi:bZIP transcription factor 50 [Oryza brachyantha]|uniref:BZIP domain-containing protein n=1 Tax=Oryza brachyantha TaxID=4533 RepID=J3MFY4_ORYBR|nr:bZIP transcription factor 50 [Oryza brachyantha]